MGEVGAAGPGQALDVVHEDQLPVDQPPKLKTIVQRRVTQLSRRLKSHRWDKRLIARCGLSRPIHGQALQGQNAMRNGRRL